MTSSRQENLDLRAEKLCLNGDTCYWVRVRGFCTYGHTLKQCQMISEQYGITIAPNQSIITEPTFSNKRKRDDEDEIDFREQKSILQPPSDKYEYQSTPLISPKSSSLPTGVGEGAGSDVGSGAVASAGMMEKCVETLEKYIKVLEAEKEDREHQNKKFLKKKNKELKELEEMLFASKDNYQYIHKKYKVEQKLRETAEAELNSFKFLKSIPDLTNNK